MGCRDLFLSHFIFHEALAMRAASKQNGLEIESPTRLRVSTTQGKLEGVPKSKLHYSRCSLNGCEIRPIGGRRSLGSVTCSILRHAGSTHATVWSATGIRSDSVTGPAGVDTAQPLGISYVENLPTKLQLMVLAPGHLELFAETQIETYVSWQPEGSAITRLSGPGVSETPVCRSRIAPEELWRVHAATSWTRVNWSDPDVIALRVPIRRPAGVVIGC